MKLIKVLEIGKSTIEITMNYNNEAITTDERTFTTKEIIKSVDVTLSASGSIVASTCKEFIYLDNGKARFGSIYITESTGSEIIAAIKGMDAQLEKELGLKTKLEINTEKATKILTIAATRTDILNEKEEAQWVKNYNNINNEGGEGYIPTRLTLEDIAWANNILK